MTVARYDEIAALRFEIKVWRFTTYCFLGSSLAFLANILIGGFRG
mgnify:CR=1 FL=1